MKVICSHRDECASKTCKHAKEHSERSLEGNCTRSPCDKIPEARCVPVTDSVEPNSTSTSNPPSKAPKKENIEMKKSLIEKVTAATKKAVAKQPELLKTAATLEAAELLVDRAVALIEPRLPFWAKGFAKHPGFRAVVANAALVGVEIALPDAPDTDIRKQIASAAAVGAYKDVLDGFNLNEMVDSLFEGKEMQALIGKATTGTKAKAAAKPAAAKAAEQPK